MARCSWASAGVAALICQLAFASPARAAEPHSIEAASELFERGVEEQRRGDYHTAALSFARADELVPDAAALEAAIKAALLADDPVLAMQLVERSRREAPTASLARAVESARAKFGRRIARVTVQCAACHVTVDGERIDADASQWVLPGDHDVVIEASGRTERRQIHVEGGATIHLVPLAAPPAAAPPPLASPPASSPTSSTRLSPAWFWAALGVTSAVGIGAFVSGVDTAAKHAAFTRTPTAQAAQDGKAAQTRTNVLVGATAVLGLATAGIGAFAVRWRDPPARGAGLRVTVSGPGVTLGGSF